MPFRVQAARGLPTQPFVPGVCPYMAIISLNSAVILERAVAKDEAFRRGATADTNGPMTRCDQYLKRAIERFPIRRRKIWRIAIRAESKDLLRAKSSARPLFADLCANSLIDFSTPPSISPTTRYRSITGASCVAACVWHGSGLPESLSTLSRRRSIDGMSRGLVTYDSAPEANDRCISSGVASALTITTGIAPVSGSRCRC
jgi:hypothetical protein